MKKNDVFEMQSSLLVFKESYCDFVINREHYDNVDSRNLKYLCSGNFYANSHFLVFRCGEYIRCNFSFNQSFETIYSSCCSLIIKRCEEIVKNWKVF